jgi:hypothetical protein
MSCLIEVWNLKVTADSVAPSELYCLFVAVLRGFGIFVGQDVGSRTARSAESDWLTVQKAIQPRGDIYVMWLLAGC